MFSFLLLTSILSFTLLGKVLTLLCNEVNCVINVGNGALSRYSRSSGDRAFLVENCQKYQTSVVTAEAIFGSPGLKHLKDHRQSVTDLVTFSSNLPDVVQLSGNHIVGKRVGSATITAQVQNPAVIVFDDTVEVTDIPVSVRSLGVSALTDASSYEEFDQDGNKEGKNVMEFHQNLTAAGQTAGISVYANYNDGTFQDITDVATISSVNPYVSVSYDAYGPLLTVTKQAKSGMNDMVKAEYKTCSSSMAGFGLVKLALDAGSSSSRSSSPSNMPSGQPTDQPSSVPSNLPTVQPSNAPHRFFQHKTHHPMGATHSALPTGMPSTPPTSMPTTNRPTAFPTISQDRYRPTGFPSTAPHQWPTSTPSKPMHSVVPTGQPSSELIPITFEISLNGATLDTFGHPEMLAFCESVSASVVGIRAAQCSVYTLQDLHEDTSLSDIVYFSNRRNRNRALTEEASTSRILSSVSVIALKINFILEVSVGKLGYGDVATTRTAITTQLSSSIDSGRFSNYLKLYSAQYGGIGLFGVTVRPGSFSTVGFTVQPSDVPTSAPTREDALFPSGVGTHTSSPSSMATKRPSAIRSDLPTYRLPTGQPTHHPASHTPTYAYTGPPSHSKYPTSRTHVPTIPPTDSGSNDYTKDTYPSPVRGIKSELWLRYVFALAAIVLLWAPGIYRYYLYQRDQAHIHQVDRQVGMEEVFLDEGTASQYVLTEATVIEPNAVGRGGIAMPLKRWNQQVLHKLSRLGSHKCK